MMKDFSMHVLDIVQNSIVAGATFIKIILDNGPEELLFSVVDNGKGMSEETVKKVRDPFVTSRTTRKVGLGIPLLEQTCSLCQGSLTLESKLGEGTTITAVMNHKSIDMPPLGDIAGAVYITLITNPDIRFLVEFPHAGFTLDTDEIHEVLEGVPFSNPDVMEWLEGSIRGGWVGEE